MRQPCNAAVWRELVQLKDPKRACTVGNINPENCPIYGQIVEMATEVAQHFSPDDMEAVEMERSVADLLNNLESILGSAQLYFVEQPVGTWLQERRRRLYRAYYSYIPGYISPKPSVALDAQGFFLEEER